MTVLLTLTIAGTDTGPFDLYSNLDVYTVAFATGISKAALQAGYVANTVPDYTTTVRVISKGRCINYTDIVLDNTTTTTSSSTTTTSTTAKPETPCNATTLSGGAGVTDNFINLSSLGGLITIAFDAQGIVDKMEIIHNGVKKATSSMTTPNEGPFDDLYGSPTVPTEAQANAVTQFIGSLRGAIPDRQAVYAEETGSSLVMVPPGQQLVWWEYTPADYAINSFVTIRVTGPSGTSWDFVRLCPPT